MRFRTSFFFFFFLFLIFWGKIGRHKSLHSVPFQGAHQMKPEGMNTHKPSKRMWVREELYILYRIKRSTENARAGHSRPCQAHSTCPLEISFYFYFYYYFLYLSLSHFFYEHYCFILWQLRCSTKWTILAASARCHTRTKLKKKKKAKNSTGNRSLWR